jgi:hypothetical protein
VRLSFHPFFFALVLLTATACAHGPVGSLAVPTVASDAYVEGLVRQAHALSVADERQWHKLLHYKLGVLGHGFLGGGYESEADGTDFFLAPRGKLDPRAELDATLRAFFLPLAAVSPRGDSDEHPLCRFPARFLYLRERLGIDPARLPVQRCPKAERFISELDPGSLTLIFSSYYLNNPASAFGHTFLRLNKQHSLVVGERRELLDFGIDYSADVDTGNAIIYAVKGMTGLFPGTFKRIPYYYKVRTYNDYESRDLWEYELSLNAAQLLMLSAHLWELGHTYFAYYYLTENCSYHILSLVEVADPSLHLLDGISAPVIPADTVRALFKQPGLVRKVGFRPSARRQFQARAGQLSSDELTLVEALAVDAQHALPPSMPAERAIAVLDAATDLIDVWYARDLVHHKDSAAAQRKQQLLERRARILQPSQPLLVERPEHERPELGHGSQRVGVGAVTADNTWGFSLDVRLAMHDLADPAPGYPELNSLEFMRVRTLFWQTQRIELKDASLVRVTSLTPQGRFDRKSSWEFDVGATTIQDSACDKCLMAHAAGGAGLTFAFFDNRLALFALAYGNLGWAPNHEGLLGSHMRVGVGPAGGVRLRLLPGAVLLGRAHWLWLPEQGIGSTYRIDTQLRVQLFAGLALGVEGQLVPNGFEAQALAFSYF